MLCEMFETKFQPTMIKVPEATLERVLLALEAGRDAAMEEHGAAILQYQERRPLRVKWYAEQVEMINAAIADLRRDIGRVKDKSNPTSGKD